MSNELVLSELNKIFDEENLSKIVIDFHNTSETSLRCFYCNDDILEYDAAIIPTCRLCCVCKTCFPEYDMHKFYEYIEEEGEDPLLECMMCHEMTDEEETLSCFHCGDICCLDCDEKHNIFADDDDSDYSNDIDAFICNSCKEIIS